MGVKSTIELTEEEALDLYVSLHNEINKRKIKAQAMTLPLYELEQELEKMNDEVNDGEGFYNYSIKR